MHQSSWIVQGTAGNAAIDTTFLGTAAPSPPWRRWRVVELSATERAEVLARPVATPPSCRDPHPPSQPLSVMIRQLLFRRRSGSIPALRLNCRCWLMGQGDGPVLLARPRPRGRQAGREKASTLLGLPFWRFCEQPAAMLATSWRLGIRSVRDAVCGRLKTYIDRWYNHLHFSTLFVLPYPLYRSPLHLLRP